MDHDTRLRITQWRKRLERRGWISLRRGAPVRDRVIEYHVIWQGWLVSGRTRLGDLDRAAGYWEPGTPVYLLERGQDVIDGVWRIARDQGGRTGQAMKSLAL